jgi:2,3-bisphosphoglycerate-independent phosphoglycerate mutase
VDDGILRESPVSGLTVGETGELAQALDDGLAGRGVWVLCTGPGTVAVGFCDAAVPYLEGEAPFAHVGKEVAAADPGRVRLPWLQACLDRAAEVLAAHPVNAIRVDLRENPANALWLWGGGPPPTACTEGGGVMMTRSVLGRGVAALRGMHVIAPPDPWAVPREAERVLAPVPDLVRALQSQDLVLVHVAAPRPGGGYGSGVDKVRALDHLDQRLLGPLLDVLDAYRPFRIVLATDAAVSTETLQPQRIATPVVLAGDGVAADAATRWEEQTCLAGRLGRMNLQDFLATARID